MDKLIDVLSDIAENLRRIAFEIETLRNKTVNNDKEESDNETV
jgi:hypothetical protein